MNGPRAGRRRWSVGVWYFQAQLAGPRTGIQKFSQYYPSSMLPPPPPAPMARPVAIIRSTGELTAASSNSPPTSSTSPTDPGELASNQDQMAAAVGLVSSGCQSSVDPAGRKSPARILVTAPHTSREYTFAHFHSQPGQVSVWMSPRLDYEVYGINWREFFFWFGCTFILFLYFIYGE